MRNDRIKTHESTHTYIYSRERENVPGKSKSSQRQEVKAKGEDGYRTSNESEGEDLCRPTFLGLTPVRKGSTANLRRTLSEQRRSKYRNGERPAIKAQRDFLWEIRVEVSRRKERKSFYSS